jgi:DNA replicative helicase MCM subunit Mcm2 (Cdc46/Mcm family)
MSISKTVTRMREVKPKLLFGSFICEVCGALVHEIEQQFRYTEVRLQCLFLLSVCPPNTVILPCPAQFMPKSNLR